MCRACKEGGIQMPYRPDTACKHPNCPNLVTYGTDYCSEHKPLHRHDRKSSYERGYNSKWRKARLVFLNQHPLCKRCYDNGRLVRATVVDHIIPHRGDQELFWDMTNWQPLCERCHNQKISLLTTPPKRGGSKKGIFSLNTKWLQSQ